MAGRVDALIKKYGDYLNAMRRALFLYEETKAEVEAEKDPVKKALGQAHLNAMAADFVQRAQMIELQLKVDAVRGQAAALADAMDEMRGKGG